MSGLSISNASQGLQASMQLFDRSAAATSRAAAQMSSGSPTNSDGSDLIDGMVGMRLAANGIKANVAVVHAADEMLGTLLDMHA